MIDFLLSLPLVLGCLLFTLLTSAAGFVVYLATFRIHDRRETPEVLHAMEGATGNLLRVVGWLFTLILSLTLTNVVAERRVARNAVEGEARAIVDVYNSLGRMGAEKTGGAGALLVEYTRSVIEDDWAALRDGRLSERTDARLRELEDALLDIQATGAGQQAALASLAADADLVSDNRFSRLAQAREEPSVVVGIVFFGYLISMAYFGIYAPKRTLVILLFLYTAYVGVAIYLVLAFGASFDGPLAVDARPLEFALERMTGGTSPPAR
ncbi:MAG: DUF4239 domain-containing protein [Myxococcota bacterium]|nr:DUF4239 domain-containing protein [Myxococcota bacterium]